MPTDRERNPARPPKRPQTVPLQDAVLQTMKGVVPKIAACADGEGLLILEPEEAQALRSFIRYLQQQLPR